jgi:hypothetical protein
MTQIEFWTGGHGLPRTAAVRARRLEAEGWTGMGVVDSQCLSGDPFVALAMAAAATSNDQARHRCDELRHPTPGGAGHRRRQRPRRVRRPDGAGHWAR